MAVLVDGNPLALSNIQNGATIEVDPDALVCWIGTPNFDPDPGFKMDLSWKNLIGQASGESYMFEWGNNKRATIIMQPSERTSGVDLSMDGRRSGGRPSRQRRIGLGTTAGDIGNLLGGGGGGFF